MNEKLLLIDGSSMLVTSFHGNINRSYYDTGDTSKLLQTSDGRFTNAVITMTKTLFSILKKQKPTHIAVAWDLNRNDLKRKKMYTEYKANRKETKPELSSQFGIMQDVLDAMGIPQYRLRGVEADDIIGTLSSSLEDEIPVYVLTKDQDALQLITEKTRVWLVTSKNKELYQARGINIKDLNIPQNVFEFTPDNFKEEYGLEPIQMIDKKAIEGDKSDNIPGVNQVGEKASLPLLQEYKTLEGIYEALENEDPKELRLFFRDHLGIKRSPIQNLLNSKDIAFLSKELATIDTHIEEFKNIPLQHLKFVLNKEKTKDIFIDLEFNSLLDELDKM